MRLYKELTDHYSLLVGTFSCPSGYEDITSIIGVGNEPNLFNIMEYNTIRKWVLMLLLEKDSNQGVAFSLCSLEEQITICKWILMPYAVRMSFFTDEEDRMNWEDLVIRTEGNPLALIHGRSLIYQRLRICVTNYVRKETWFPGDYYANLNYAQQFLRDVYLMKEFFIAANDPEFGQFLRSDGVHSSTGLNSKLYWLQSLEDDLLEIYNQY
jgi:hypothetical protein